MQGVPVSKASVIISKEWKKVKASDKKIKKYRDLYEEEKQRHEEALQRYQEDNMDEMEIINLHKRCNKKARKTPLPKKALKSTKSDDSNEEKQGPKKHQGQAMEKRSLQKQEKKLKRPHSLKKHQSHLNLLTQARKKKKGCPRTIKGKKYLLYWG